jgi:hypothetical protein
MTTYDQLVRSATCNHQTVQTMNNWSDQINTPLNACSIETYVPVPNEDLVTNYCDSDVATSPPYDSVIPLVIGCYQLNESSAIGSAPETIYSSMSASRVGDSIDGEGASADVSGRSGELRLYMISSTTELMSPSTKAANKTRAKKEGVRFGDVSCVVKMESGVLDGKWRKRRRANRTSSASDCYEATPLFANACASGKIHLHYLQKERNTKGWSLLHLISSDDQPSTEESSLCLSLAWNDFIDMDYGGSSSNINADQIVSSYSNGKVALHRVLAGTRERELSNDDTGDIGDNWKNRICIEETHRWNAHHMFGCPSEVWTCSFLRDNANMVLSGADDVSLLSVSRSS